MLIAPSWGGMVNGLLTLRGAWDRVREDPVLKFMVVGITAYGMATFEGPMLSLKNVNALTHYTDYIIGHVHLGALAWNGGLSFATLYYVVPRIYRNEALFAASRERALLAGDAGHLFYVIPMYVGGITQSLMWQEFTAEGTLRYPNFLETVVRLRPMYALRAAGVRSSCWVRSSRSTTSIARRGRVHFSPTSKSLLHHSAVRRPPETGRPIGCWNRGRCSSRCSRSWLWLSAVSSNSCRQR